MTSPSDTQLPAGGANKHGWGMGISLGFAGLAMIVLLVLPGFLAAGFSRMTDGFFSENGDVVWDGYFPLLSEPACFRAELIMLAPPARIATRSVAGRSGWVMKHSPPMRRFYNWEYDSAGGLDIDLTAPYTYSARGCLTCSRWRT